MMFALLLAAGCGSMPEIGVSQGLSTSRAAQIHELRYLLHFDVPQELGKHVEAVETVSFRLDEKSQVILDFREDPLFLHSLSVNGVKCDINAVNEHIIIPKKLTSIGENRIEISFRAGEQSLNRRKELMYTLLVPDRARTLFPCFDQPDLKAKYTLSLSVPEEWTAVSNTYVCDESCENGRKNIGFAETEPLSTYLFSFVAGRFERSFAERGGRIISMYYRETDPMKLAQKPAIFDLVFDALDYMEEYTGIPYPFAKYDFVVLPDFQYGGMEHTGATLYNDRRIFLGPKPTTAELLDRAQLIAHETAHMWFGDYVTMKWFDDVWTKEVFANWFAAQIVRPAFPEVNHQLGDLKTYYAPAYAEDRTVGSNAIRRPLDNLNNAGLIYCNIIYDKAPVAMDCLARQMGMEAFRRGLQRYLRDFGYGNASWPDLVECLDKENDFDVAMWSRAWIENAGMPCLDAGSFTSDDKAYGWYSLDEKNAANVYSAYATMDETERMRELMNLYENVWRKRLNTDRFVEWIAGTLLHEDNPLIFGSLLSYAADALHWKQSNAEQLEQVLLQIAQDTARPHEMRLQAFRTLYGIVQSPEICEILYDNWKHQVPFTGLTLSENDYINLSYQLMLRFPEKSEIIRQTQRSRIDNADRLASFDFVSQAAAAEKDKRDAFFESLFLAENRRPESRVLAALDLLCHPIRGEEAVSRIRPALEILPEIQRTGDIFFPASWCKRILAPQTSDEAKEEVEAFLASHESMHPLLKTKILQAAGWLLQ